MIKLLKLVETHVLVIIVEPGTKFMDPEIKRSRLNMKASLTLTMNTVPYLARSTILVIIPGFFSQIFGGQRGY